MCPEHASRPQRCLRASDMNIEITRLLKCSLENCPLWSLSTDPVVLFGDDDVSEAVLILLPSWWWLSKWISHSQPYFLTLPGGSDGKQSACNAGDLGLIPGSGRSPWRREQRPTPVFLPGESHGQRSLVRYSPWSRKESDTTEGLTQIHSPTSWRGMTSTIV